MSDLVPACLKRCIQVNSTALRRVVAAHCDSTVDDGRASRPSTQASSRVLELFFYPLHLFGSALPQHRAAPNTTEPDARAVVAMSQHV
jgi:hypothetical protein